MKKLIRFLLRNYGQAILRDIVDFVLDLLLRDRVRDTSTLNIKEREGIVKEVTKRL